MHGDMRLAPRATSQAVKATDRKSVMTGSTPVWASKPSLYGGGLRALLFSCGHHVEALIPPCTPSLCVELPPATTVGVKCASSGALGLGAPHSYCRTDD